MNLKLFKTSDQGGGSGRVSIIRAVTSYLGFLVFLALVVEAVLGVLVLKENGDSQRVALYGFLAVIITLIGVVSFFQYIAPSNLTSAALHDLSDFGRKIEGYWWEFVIPSAPTAISLLQIVVDRQIGSVRLSGTAYDEDGNFTATWDSVATCINLPESKLFYYWRGTHLSRPDEPFEGFGEMSFNGSTSVEEYSRGHGIFFDSNLANVIETKRKSTRLVRCDDAELKTVQGSDATAAAGLIKQKNSGHSEAT